MPVAAGAQDGPAGTADDADLRAGVGSAIAAFAETMVNQDAEAMIAAMPPSVIAELAEHYRVDRELLTQQLIAMMTQMFSTMQLDDFGVDLDSATFGRTSEGRGYGLIPASTTMTLPQGQFIGEDTILAVQEQGTWYLMRLAEQEQIDFMRAAFPDLAHLEIPAATFRTASNTE